MSLTRAVFFAATVLSVAPFHATAQQAIYVVRHAEQASGVDDPALTAEGHRRAVALAETLRNSGITGIYSSRAQRTRQTAQAAADAFGIQVRQVPREETAELVRRIRAEEPTGRVLVVGHSETVPQILRALGYPEPIMIDKREYDNVFLVIPRGTSTPLVLRQRLTAPSGLFSAVVPEAAVQTPQVSTEELDAMLGGGSAVLLDTRPRMEWAVSHIPGALNVAPKPDMPMHLYTSDAAEVERLVAGDKTKPVILTCNGPFCEKSARVAAELLAAGFESVRRYQLGAPFWRALGRPMVTEPEAARYVFDKDATAVWIDARTPEQFQAGTVQGAVNLPWHALERDEERVVKAAKNDGRLPMQDHNTRVIVFGSDARQARAVADVIARNAFHNVSYFEGNAETLGAILR